jgi:hypothetical protein
MSLTFLQIQKRVGKNIKRFDDTSGWKASPADVSQNDVKELINETYLEDLAPLFINKYPQDFRTIARADSWIATGTVDAASTSTTLVTTTAIFTNSMVGLYVYNSDLTTSAKITDFTSSTTVTVDITIGNTWDGDTIWVLGQEFSFGGDASDIYQLESIGIKYSSAATYYKKATIINKPALFREGWEIGGETSPFAYLTTLNIGDVLTSGVGISPQFTAKISEAIEISALVRPPALSADGDIPRLPVASALIAGATARAFANKHDFDKAAYWEKLYAKKTLESVARYIPMKAKYGTGIRPNRRVNAMMSRRI